MRKLISMMGVIVMAGASASCGGPNEDGVKALMAFGSPSTSRMLREAMREAHARAHQKADEVKARAELAARLRDMSVMSSLQRELTIGDAGCDDNTPGDLTDFDVTCTWTFSGETASCGGTVYTYNDGTGTLNFDMAVSGNTATITAGIGIDSNVSGGEIDGSINVNCNLGFEMSMDVSTGAASFSVGGCGGFSCTIDGDEVDCEDMQEAVSETSC